MNIKHPFGAGLVTGILLALAQPAEAREDVSHPNMSSPSYSQQGFGGSSDRSTTRRRGSWWNPFPHSGGGERSRTKPPGRHDTVGRDGNVCRGCNRDNGQ